MLRIFYYLTAITCLFFMSCKKDEEKQQEIDQAYYDANDAQIQDYIKKNGITNALPTGNGTFYAIQNPLPAAQKVNDGDSLRVHYTLRLLNGSIVDTTSRVRNLPARYLVNTESILPGLEDALRLMREGEKATILIPSYRALTVNSTNNIPPYSVLVYDLELIEVKSEEEQIAEYITKNALTVTETKDNVRRILTSAGANNTKLTAGQIHYICYRGTLLNDKLFDQSQDSTFTVSVGVTSLITGFTTSLQMMNEGEEATVIFPSSVAYGRQGSGSSIPPYAPLLFKIKAVKTERQQMKDNFAAKGITDTTYNTTGVYHRITTVGTGAQANANSRVVIRYKSKLLNDAIIQYPSNVVPLSTNEREETLSLSDATYTLSPWFVTGLKQMVIAMKVGEKREVWVPSTLAFGEKGYLNVRERTPIMFEVELKSIL